MFCLTPNERKALLFVAFLILSGSLLRVLKLNSDKNPQILKSAKAAQEKTPLNINTASKDQLKTIPGIGPVTAQRILDFRKTYGFFENADDLKKIKGIGDKKIEIIKQYILLK